ncbi:MAG: sialidase family protein [Candidatus Competibacteraceae bacterium]
MKHVKPSSKAPLGVVILLGCIVSSSAFAGILIGPNINVTQAPNTQAEQAVTIDRANPNNIFIAANGSGGYGDHLASARSTDGGGNKPNSWLRGEYANGADNLDPACCDPSLASDTFGNLYTAYLNNSNPLQVIVGISADHGQTWTNLANFGGGDEPTIVVGPGKSAGEQSVWVTWNNTDTGYLMTANATVTNLGLSPFSTPQEVPDSYGESLGDIAIGPGGKVAVAHQYSYNYSDQGPNDPINININPDGIGGAFGAPVVATLTNVGAYDFLPAQPNRTVDAEAGLAWNLNTNRLFLVYTDENPDESNDTDIMLRYSDDDGQHWSDSRRINDDKTHCSQFLPKIALDSVTGNLAIVWYDARNDQGSSSDGQCDGIDANEEVELWGTLSLDGGLSFVPNFKISEGKSSALIAAQVTDNNDPGFDFGDYIGLDFFDNVVHAVWADNSNSTGDNPLLTFDAYTARIDIVAEPTTFALLSLGLLGIGFGKRHRN